MAEPRKVGGVAGGKTPAQLDAQIERIRGAYNSAVERAEWGSPEFRRQQRRWFNATEAHGRLRGDDKLIESFKDYRPARWGFTSKAEMDKIDKHFGLSERNTASLNALRNNVVEYYSNLPRATRREDDMSEWMQSIVAVIDEHIRRKGGRL